MLQTDFGMSDPPALARAFIDNAIILSQNLSLDGRIGLHAAAAGGGALLKVYSNCGLRQLASAAILPTGVKRKNDGRFFYADETTAEMLAQTLDPSR